MYVGTVKWEVYVKCPVEVNNSFSTKSLTAYSKEAVDSNMVFFDAYRAKSKPAGTLPLLNVLDKHNHLRYYFSYDTGHDNN